MKREQNQQFPPGVCAAGRFCRQADDADRGVELVESYANPGGLAVNLNLVNTSRLQCRHRAGEILVFVRVGQSVRMV